MKKKILCLILICMFAFSTIFLTGCNQQVFDFNYTFNYAYVKIGDKWVDLEITKWCDYEGEQLQLTLKDGTVMIVSSINCILYNGRLPK